MVHRQAESGRQSSTSKYCLPVTNIWQNNNQGLPDARRTSPWPSGWKNNKNIWCSLQEMIWHKRYELPLTLKHSPIFQLHGSTWPLLGHSTSSKCFHYHQTTVYVDWRSLGGSFERIESIRDRLDLWKMGAAFDTPFRWENPRLFNAFTKSVLHTS